MKKGPGRSSLSPSGGGTYMLLWGDKGPSTEYVCGSMPTMGFLSSVGYTYGQDVTFTAR